MTKTTRNDSQRMVMVFCQKCYMGDDDNQTHSEDVVSLVYHSNQPASLDMANKVTKVLLLWS